MINGNSHNLLPIHVDMDQYPVWPTMCSNSTGAQDGYSRHETKRSVLIDGEGQIVFLTLWRRYVFDGVR